MQLGLYLHIPFCRSKCRYCDFVSYAGLEDLHAAYAQALVSELDQLGRPTVDTVYLGGGTPTAVPIALLERILEATWRACCIAPGTEATVEANPGTLDRHALGVLRRLAVNRLSLGVQSLDDRELALLGRIHTAHQAIECFADARRCGFDSVSLDLIFGLPGQPLDSWQDTLERVVALQPDHLSLYALTLEPGTPLEADVRAGLLPEPDPDVAADMYEAAQGILEAAGFAHYEISNWARGPGHECKHNLGYWRNEPYLGVGAGAHSWRGGMRWANVATPAEYVACAHRGASPVASRELIGGDLEIGETLMMGLRLLVEGMEFDRFRTRFGMDLRDRFAHELDELAGLGLLVVEPTRIRLSNRGRLLGNQVFHRFLADPAGTGAQGEE